MIAAYKLNNVPDLSKAFILQASSDSMFSYDYDGKCCQ